MCSVKDCGRPVFARGRCGFHALQGVYRTEVRKEEGLVAARVPGRVRVLSPRPRRDPARPRPA